VTVVEAILQIFHLLPKAKWGYFLLCFYLFIYFF
jgi:hypothetical protein